jgi:coenzyme F420 hydrogenase subunit delta
VCSSDLEQKPKQIIIVDAVTVEEKKPGEIYELPLDNLVKEKIDDFSLHQGPTSNLLKELRDLCGVDVVIIACQPENIPKEMFRGLSNPVKEAVSKTAELIYRRFLCTNGVLRKA